MSQCPRTVREHQERRRPHDPRVVGPMSGAEKRAPTHPAARSPRPLTITVATSPSLVDRFHSSTLKCLKTLRNGCCHTGGTGRSGDLPQVPDPGRGRGLGLHAPQ